MNQEQPPTPAAAPGPTPMKRYNPFGRDTMIVKTDGEYVKYADYERETTALKAELDAERELADALAERVKQALGETDSWTDLTCRFDKATVLAMRAAVARHTAARATKG